MALQIETIKNKSKHEFPHRLALDAYGVRVAIDTNSEKALRVLTDEVSKLLPSFSLIGPAAPFDHSFRYRWNAAGRDTLYQNNEKVAGYRHRESVLEKFRAILRLTVAEFAVDRVFIHAGVVVWRGRAVLLPARSFKGKSTLTAELVRRGATYYSDEYAILDADGFVHPFPKAISIRGGANPYEQFDRPVESFGGIAGTGPAPVELVVITEFSPNAKWNPKVLSAAAGTMEIIKNAIPIRRNPKATIEIIGKLANARFIKTKRGDARAAAEEILRYF